jgi:hypothetical protein
MNAIIKYLSAEDNEYIEDINGAIPALEWTDNIGDVRRAFVIECNFQLQLRKFKLTVITQIQTKSGDWRYDHKIPVYYPEANDSTYVYINTGLVENDPYVENPFSSEKVLKEGIQTESQFFIDNFGKNKNNLTLKLYSFFFKPIIAKHNLTIE